MALIVQKYGGTSVGSLERIKAVAERAASTGKADLQFAELENRQKLWRWVIIAAIVLLLGETWLAGRTTRRMSTLPATSASGGFA